ncbi:mechanosensitive ion channel family protein [Echinicola pacifica]|nr:mechanosensitive ion channel domain-containing protein [Echinicola pacifica]
MRLLDNYTKAFTVFVCFCFMGISTSGYSYQIQGALEGIKDSLFSEGPDTTKVEEEPKRRSINSMIHSVEAYILATNHINKVLSREVDTTEVSAEFPEVERRIQAVKTRLGVDDSDINLRYLDGLRDFTKYQSERLEYYKDIIDERSTEVVTAYDSLRAIKEDRVFEINIKDSLVLGAFQEQLKELKARVAIGDSLFMDRQLEIADFQSKLSNSLIDVKDFMEEIDERERKLERALFNKEVNYIWEKGPDEKFKEIKDVFNYSLVMNSILLRVYSEAHLSVHWVVGILMLAFYIWFKYLLRRIKIEKEFADIILQRTQFIPKFPLLSALIIVLPFVSFLYDNPPVVLVVLVLALLMVVTTVLITSSLKKGNMWYWYAFLLMFALYSVSNLYIERALLERWPLLVLSLLSLGLGVRIIQVAKVSSVKRPKYVIFLLRMFLVIQGGSLIANILGRYSLAKILGVAAMTSLMQAVGLFVFVLVIMEAIYLQIEVGKKSSKDYTAYFDFQDIQDKVKRVFVFLATMIWLYYLVVNLTVYDFLHFHVMAFLSKSRGIGQTEFNFGSVFTFIIILWISSILSKYISYFVEAKDQKMAANRKQRLGSSILLIKLAVFSIGFLLAVTAAGIPLDNVAIVLGALSVGIGFGLQTIINNLVSGIILAFERPIQIGDAIEVAGQSGVVKEVGIRASKIQAYDGSEVVMPNGDLLSQQLVNWTLSNKRRRVELFIGVAYGSDTEEVEGLLFEIISREGVMRNPAPSVFLQNFADSAVEYRVLFWVNDFDDWVGMRNEVMKDIYKKFNEHNIEIPFPQRDLHIRSTVTGTPVVIPEKEKTDKPEEDLPADEGDEKKE